MSQKKNEGILFSAEIRVVGSYTDRLLTLQKTLLALLLFPGTKTTFQRRLIMRVLGESLRLGLKLHTYSIA